MQNFLTTLAQLTATLLSIFLAAVTAYYVFLQDRSAQFREKIDLTKLEISDDLIQFRSIWPWTLTMYLPPEFKDTYRSKYENKSQPDLVTQAAIDIIFQNRELIDALSEIRERDSFGGPYSEKKPITPAYRQFLKIPKLKITVTYQHPSCFFKTLRRNTKNNIQFD